jgi:hypothetical protein
MRLVVALLLTVGVAAPVRGDALDEVRTAQGEVSQLDGARAQLDGQRARLERDSHDLAAQIEQAKAEPAGVRHDLKLGELLAASKAKTDELERVATELRARNASLSTARRNLIGACDRALARAGTFAEARRLELARLRTAQATLLAAPAQPLDIGRAADDPLDGPRELQEKADLLRDSQDKLKREVERLATRIDDVERRRHLRERASAVDEDWFGEATSNRKVARSSTNVLTPSGARGADTTQGATPAPQAPAGGNFNNSPSLSDNSKSDTTTVLRNLVDPATLDELRRADGGDDLDRQVRALKRAQGELEGLSRELDRRARALSARADELKHKK